MPERWLVAKTLYWVVRMVQLLVKLFRRGSKSSKPAPAAARSNRPQVVEVGACG
jgi:hypothetical protein